MARRVACLLLPVLLSWSTATVAAAATQATPVSRGLPRCPQDTDAVLQFPVANETYRVGSSAGSGGWSGVHATASLPWPRINHTADVHVMAGLVSPAEAAGLIALLDDAHTDGMEFDVDKDTVDRMATYEFYLQKNGNVDDVATIPGKAEAAAAAAAAAARSSGGGSGGAPATATAVTEAQSRRAAVREQAVALTAPILAERIVPLVNELYAADCSGRCRPCFSFVRRYDQGLRTTHQAHLDVQALVTVVVSLNSYGHDFDGGLYVSTGNSHEATRYLALQAGDAVLHQSDLLHGVRVGEGQRWSWILWFYDGGDDCSAADPSRWFRRQADAGDPLAQFLQAKRAHMAAPGRGVGGGNDDDPAAEASSDDVDGARRRWLEAAAAGGFARAENDLAALLTEDADAAALREEEHERMVRQFGGRSRTRPAAAAAEVAVNSAGGAAAVEKPSEALRRRARDLYARAAEFEADAVYNLGRLALRQALAQAEQRPGSAAGAFDEAVGLFSRAAEMGSTLAMHNLGVALQNGRGVPARDPDAALRWFACTESAEGMRLAAGVYAAKAAAAAQAKAVAEARAGELGEAAEEVEEEATEAVAEAAAALSGDGNSTSAAAMAAAAAEFALRAREWYERAARMGDGTAQWQLVKDDHAAGDDARALEWLRMAADQNFDAQAMYTIGRLLLSRVASGVVGAQGGAPATTAAEREAGEQLRKAAALGWEPAQQFLASLQHGKPQQVL